MEEVVGEVKDPVLYSDLGEGDQNQEPRNGVRDGRPG